MDRPHRRKFLGATYGYYGGQLAKSGLKGRRSLRSDVHEQIKAVPKKYRDYRHVAQQPVARIPAPKIAGSFEDRSKYISGRFRCRLYQSFLFYQMFSKTLRHTTAFLPKGAMK